MKVLISLFFPLFVSLYSSGLSYEESKELTKAVPNQKSARPRTPPDQKKPVTKALEDTMNSSVRDAAADDIKPTQTSRELLKDHFGQKASVSITEPMRTRHSHNTEDRKLNPAAQSGSTPTGKTPEVEKWTENSSPSVPLEKELKEEKKSQVPLSPVKESPPLKAGTDLGEVQLETPLKPSVNSKDIITESNVTLDTQKRKSPCESEGDVTPEKRPRLSSVSSVSSVSSSPSASSMSSPAAPSPTSQKVPPLKVRKYCIKFLDSTDLVHEYLGQYSLFQREAALVAWICINQRLFPGCAKFSIVTTY